MILACRAGNRTAFGAAERGEGREVRLAYKWQPCRVGIWIMDKDCELVASGLALVPPLSARFLLPRQHQAQLIAPVFLIEVRQHPDAVRAGNLQREGASLLRPFQQPARAFRRVCIHFLEDKLLAFKEIPCLVAQFGIVHVQNQFHILPPLIVWGSYHF